MPSRLFLGLLVTGSSPSPSLSCPEKPNWNNACALMLGAWASSCTQKGKTPALQETWVWLRPKPQPENVL